MSEVFLNVVNMSISAGWLILAVLALRLLLKKAPKWVNVVLWGIVALRLLSPFSIESALSLVPSAETISPEIMMDRTPEITTGIPVLNSAINPVISGSFAPNPGASANPLQILIPVAANLWLLGVLVMLLYAAVSYISLGRKVRTAVILKENIYQCESVASPFVLGILKPRIYLPYAMDPESLRHVVAHEQAHIRRKDHWWKPLGFLLLALHWFNPLMWLAYILLCRDIELACDERVIAQLGNAQRADYTQALVACSVGRTMIAACPLAFGEVGVKERVKSVMNYRKPTFWIIVTAVIVCGAVAVCFLTDPRPSPEFAMSGSNVSHLDAEKIVDRIARYEKVENSNVYMNSNNFTLTLDADFDWADSQTIRYFFWENHEHHSGQLRIFPEEGKYFLTEAETWTQQDRIYLLRHYLDALKYLPREAIRQMAPADRYLIRHVEEGRPSDYDRVIRYSSRGVEDTAGWLIHLQVHPLHADGEGYSGTGDEWLELFYGTADSSGNVQMWFNYELDPVGMSYEEDLKIGLDAFPGITFRYTPYGITVGEMELISGMPVWNAYFCDLTGDGKPEICAQASWGSGMIDSRVIIFDYANGTRYTLADRGKYDYYLRLDTDGCLYVDKKAYQSDQTIFSGRLTFRDGAIALDDVNIQGTHVFRARILEIHDTYFLVEPVEGSPQLRSADRIQVDRKYLTSAPEPRVGDILQIEYDGQIQETYPARIPNVYHIALEQTHVWSSYMTPTETNLEGLQAGALLVPMGTRTFRYAISDMRPENVSAETLLLSFTEHTAGEDIQWEVWSLKEYPERTVVMMLSPDYGGYLCRYDPPGSCADTALEEAIQSGNPVIMDGFAAHGQETWKAFLDSTRQGTPASVTVAVYITLDPNRCDDAFYEIFRQDYPALDLHELTFDGERYTLRTRSGEGEFIQNFEYLMCYPTAAISAVSSEEPDTILRYVLVDDKTVTWEQIWNGTASSLPGAYIHHAFVYTEVVDGQSAFTIPQSLTRADLMGGDTLLAAYQEKKMLGRLEAFLLEAESLAQPPENVRLECSLILTGKDGRTAKLEIDSENDGFFLNGVYYDCSPDTDGTMELLRLLGFEQWPSQR